ncbi:ABC transporter substrate binding protein [mine drainage metagenome]|uniref:ABC transporter substrate binding protein n=1 Tax=mine drainage metagenome TaxID=410659 RepID=A0A1J5R5P5_9ZZZZ
MTLCRRRFLLLACAGWLITAAPAQAAGRGVVVVASAESADYAQAIAALSEQLPRGTVTVVAAADFPTRAAPPPELYIALGSAAARALAAVEEAGHVPQLYALLPRQRFERIVGSRKTPRSLSAIYLDQPFSRQLDLLHLALPGARRIGVLWGPGSRLLAPALATAASARNLRLVEATLAPDQPLYPALARALDRADALLAVADPLVYNGNTIENLLLASFRAGVPLVAFSPAYVRAGALLGLYSTPAQIGTQAGTMARALLQGRSLPAPQYPTEFTVEINRHVARALGLDLNAAALATRLQQMEHVP